MFLSAARSRSIALLACLASAASCGARTGIETSDAGAAPRACTTDGECGTADACAPAECREGTCVPLPAIICDDNDACTIDSCDPNSGKCRYASRTLDLDGDGHKSPLPGLAPGSVGACGDDCDDKSAAAHPGGVEICDGVDNDCNGIVDDGAAYGGAVGAVRVSSTVFDRASSGALAFDGKIYGAVYTGHRSISSSYFRGLAPDGTTVVAETPLTDINSETYSGTILYNGRFFERVWEDARQDQNYEVYFNRFDASGKKLGPDVRVTKARDFSLNSSLIWNGSESLLVWDDRRFDVGSTADVRVFGQRVAFDGSLVGSNVELTPGGVQAEHPGIALGEKRVGVVFASQVSSAVRHANFLTTLPDFSDVRPPVDLGGDDVQSTSLVHLAGRYLVAWEQNSTSTGYGPAIFGAVVDENGNVLRPAQPITSGATIARSFSLLSLGDRGLLVWADNHDGNFELYSQILGANLQVLSPRMRLTFTPSDTFFPSASFGPNGDVGVIYQDWQTNFSQVYFLSMGCVMGVPSR